MHNIIKCYMIAGVILAMMFTTSCSAINDFSGENKGSNNTYNLFKAISNNNFEAAKEAVESGVNIEKFPFPSMALTHDNVVIKNPTLYALIKMEEQIAAYLIEQGANPNYADSSGVSLLMYCGKNCDQSFCDLLLKRGANIHYKGINSYTALDYMLSNVNRKEIDLDSMMTYLLNQGAKVSPNTLDAILQQPADKTNYRYGLIKRVVEILVQSGQKTNLDPVLEAAILGNSLQVKNDMQSNPDNITELDKKKIFLYTVAYGSPDTLELLEERNISLNPEDPFEPDAFIIAARYGNLNMVKWLWEKDGNMKWENSFSEALYNAAENQQYETIKYLIGLNAQPFNQSMVVSKAMQSGSMKTVEFLEEIGYLDKIGSDNAIFGAAKNNQPEILQYLITRNKRFNIQMSDMPMLFNDICQSGYTEIAKLLINNGANVNGNESADDNGAIKRGEPLRNAAISGHTEIVEYLISHGADVNARIIYPDGSKATTALTEAIRYGQFDIVKLLVEHGADLYSEDGQSSSELAGELGSRRISEYIREQEQGEK